MVCRAHVYKFHVSWSTVIFIVSHGPLLCWTKSPLNIVTNDAVNAKGRHGVHCTLMDERHRRIAAALSWHRAACYPLPPHAHTLHSLLSHCGSHATLPFIMEPLRQLLQPNITRSLGLAFSHNTNQTKHPHMWSRCVILHVSGMVKKPDNARLQPKRFHSKTGFVSSHRVSDCLF